MGCGNSKKVVDGADGGGADDMVKSKAIAANAAADAQMTSVMPGDTGAGESERARKKTTSQPGARNADMLEVRRSSPGCAAPLCATVQPCTPPSPFLRKGAR